MGFFVLGFPLDKVKNIGFVSTNKDDKQFRLTLASNTGMDVRLIYEAQIAQTSNDVRVYIHYNSDTEDMQEFNKRLVGMKKVTNFITNSLYN